MASTEKSVKANQNNAKKSTGPRTEAGKAKSRGNAVKKGTHCRKVVPIHQTLDFETRMRNWANHDAPPDDHREQHALKQAVMASLRSDNGQCLLCDRSNKRHDRAVAKHERMIQEAFDEALKLVKEDPTKTALLEAVSIGCETLANDWKEALKGLQEADPDQPLPAEVFAQIAGLLGLQANANDYGPAWEALRSELGGVLSPEDRQAWVDLMEDKIAYYEEKTEEVGEKENDALEAALNRAHADDTPTGRRLRADIDKAVRQMKSWFAVLDKYKNDRLKATRQRERVAAADSAKARKELEGLLRGAVSKHKAEVGPKTNNGPVLKTQVSENVGVVTTPSSARPVHGTGSPTVSQPSQGPQVGQDVRPTKVGPMSVPSYDTLMPKPDEVWTDLKAIGRQKREERMRKRHRRR